MSQPLDEFGTVIKRRVRLADVAERRGGDKPVLSGDGFYPAPRAMLQRRIRLRDAALEGTVIKRRVRLADVAERRGGDFNVLSGDVEICAAPIAAMLQRRIRLRDAALGLCNQNAGLGRIRHPW